MRSNPDTREEILKGIKMFYEGKTFVKTSWLLDRILEKPSCFPKITSYNNQQSMLCQITLGFNEMGFEPQGGKRGGKVYVIRRDL